MLYNLPQFMWAMHQLFEVLSFFLLILYFWTIWLFQLILDFFQRSYTVELFDW